MSVIVINQRARIFCRGVDDIVQCARLDVVVDGNSTDDAVLHLI